MCVCVLGQGLIVTSVKVQKPDNEYVEALKLAVTHKKRAGVTIQVFTYF